MKNRTYDFFKVIEDIEYISSDNTKFLIKKGDVLMRVGEGLTNQKLPVESIYLFGYQNLLLNKKIELIIEKKEIMVQMLLFQSIITELTIKITSEVLSHFNTFKEFIVVPEKVKNVFNSDIKEILE